MSHGRARALLLAATLAACAVPTPFEGARRDTVPIAAGRYRLGSGAAERALGYRLAVPTVRAQGWYDAWELPPHDVEVPGFRIDRTPVRQNDFARFVTATGYSPPDISRRRYRAQGFLVHPFEAVLPYRWQEERPPPERSDHPVVLVDRPAAVAYCAWRRARLPTEEEWEAACRGEAGRLFPWGSAWRPGAAQVRAQGTAPVDAHPLGATPDGVLDLAGNVFEWTASAFDDTRAVLKGCSWDDDPGTCRCSFRHGRPPSSRHILIGFRCVEEP